MGEYICTTIKFGGKLKASEVDTLIEVLNIYNFRDNEDEGDPDPTNLGHEFRANEVNYGQIDDVLSFCQENGLDYEHYTDACAGAPESVTRCVDRKLQTLDYADGSPVIPLKQVLEVETLASGLADLIALAKRWATPLKLEIVP